VWLLDWKLNNVYAGVSSQLAAYRFAWNGMQRSQKRKIDKVGAIVLKEDSYRLVEYEIKDWPDHWNTFKKALKARKETENESI
jgi:hypothetical protein